MGAQLHCIKVVHDRAKQRLFKILGRYIHCTCKQGVAASACNSYRHHIFQQLAKLLYSGVTILGNISGMIEHIQPHTHACTQMRVRAHTHTNFAVERDQASTGHNQHVSGWFKNNHQLINNYVSHSYTICTYIMN